MIFLVELCAALSQRSYNPLGKSAVFIITDIKMSTDGVEHSEAHHEQAGKDVSPFNVYF